ncbi:hypothetical protein J6590_021267 [Homalodisca vitripennis]|nr:hypothetical protein J6590_021267 [Homalodisca vitripennis]
MEEECFTANVLFGTDPKDVRQGGSSTSKFVVSWRFFSRGRGDVSKNTNGHGSVETGFAPCIVLLHQVQSRRISCNRSLPYLLKQEVKLMCSF